MGGIEIPSSHHQSQMPICYLNTINRWCTSIGIKLSTLKSQAIMFTHKSKWYLDKPLSVNHSDIPLVTEVCYLGVMIDSKLSWCTQGKLESSGTIIILQEDMGPRPHVCPMDLSPGSPSLTPLWSGSLVPL